MRNLFAPIKNAELSKTYFSSVVMSGIGTGVPISLISGSASLTKNGASLNDGVISNNDTLGIYTTSSSAYGTTNFVVVRIGKDDVILSVTTQQDPAKYNFAGFAGLTPLELTKYQSGQDYIPNPIDNALSVYKTDGTLLSTIAAKAPATNGVTSNDVIVVADYYSRNILKIDTVTKAVISAIDVGNRPYGVAHTPTSDTDATSLTWVSVYGDNKVVVLDRNNNVVKTHYTGEKPMGIAVTQDGKHLFVANNAAGTVTHFQLSGSTWTSQDVTVGAKPFEIATDLRGNAWVTCTGTNKVYRITRDNVVTAFVVGDGPRGVLLDASGNVWVALANENSVAKLNPTNSIITKIATHQVPFALALGKDGAVYVSNFGDSTVQKIVNNSVVSTTAVSKWPYGIAIDNSNQLWVANLYSNTPEYLYGYDQTPLGFGIADQTNVRPSTLVTSNTVTVAEVNTPTPVAVPNLYGATIIKNGTSVGTTTSVSNGDTIAFSFTTPAQYDTQIDFPIFIGLQSESFQAYILPEDRTPDAFSFTATIGDPSAAYTSNTITVSGVDATATLPISISEGSLIINGTNINATTGSVKLGDTVAIRANSPDNADDVKFISVSINGVSARWSITAYVNNNDLWTLPAYKDTSVYEPAFSGIVSSNRLTRVSIADLSMQYWPLTATPGDVNTSGNPAWRYVPKTTDGELVGVDAGGNTTYAIFNPASVKDNVLPVYIHANRFVSCHYFTPSVNGGETHGAIYDVQRNQFTELPARPRHSVLVGTLLYVAMSNGEIAVIDTATGTLTKHYAVGANLQAITADASGNIWASDLVQDRVYKIRNDVVAGQIDNVGGDIRDMVANASYLWTANSYDNNVSKISLSSMNVVKRINTGSVPNTLALDKNGRVWVGHFGSRDVVILDPNTDARLNHVMLGAGTALGLDADGDYMWVSETYDTTNSAKLSTLKPLSVTFPDVLDVKLNTVARSQEVIVNSLIRPMKVSLQPGSGRLYVNGSSVTSATIDNGTKLALELDAGNAYYTDLYATLVSSTSSASFHIRTEADIYADNVLFTPQFDAYIRQNVASNTVGITGISPNTSITLRPSESSWWLIVNGVAQAAGASVQVQLNDSVSLIGPAKGQYGTTQSYGLIQVYPDLTEATLGTFVVTNKALDGPVPSASKAARSGKNDWQRDLGYSYQSVANAGYLNTNYRDYAKQSSPASYVRDVSKLTLAEVDRVFDAIGAGNLHVVSMPNVVSRPNALQTQAMPTAVRSPNTTQTQPMPTAVRAANTTQTQSMTYERLSNTHTFSPLAQYQRSSAYSLRTMDVQYVQRTRHNFYLGDDLAVIELDSIQYPYRSNYVSPIVEWERNVRFAQREITTDWGRNNTSAQKLVVPEWERNVRFTRLTYAPTWARNTRFAQLSISVAYVKHTNAYRNVQAQYTQLPRKTLREVYPQPMTVSTRRLTVGIELEYVKVSGSQGVGAEFTYARNVRPVISVSDAQYEVNTRHIAPSAEATFARQVRHVAPSAQAQFTVLKRTVMTSSVDAAYSKAVAQPNHRYTSEAAPFAKSRGAFVLLEERQAFSRYVRHDYTVNEDAATEGAYETAADAIAAGVAAGFPKAYAVALPRGHFMWATPMPRDAGPPPLYPIPEKWYVHGG